MVGVSKVELENCNPNEMYVHAVNLKESGKSNYRDTALKVSVK